MLIEKIIVTVLLILNIITTILFEYRLTILSDAMNRCSRQLPALFIEMMRKYPKITMLEGLTLLASTIILAGCSIYLIFWR